MVCPWDVGFVGALEAFYALATVGGLSVSWRLRLKVQIYFEITCVIFVLGSASVLHASMRACRFVPLPEIRTVRLCCCAIVVGGMKGVG